MQNNWNDCQLDAVECIPKCALHISFGVYTQNILYAEKDKQQQRIESISSFK